METTIDEEVQADIPEQIGEETVLKIRPLERITRYPKDPVEPSAYGKGKKTSVDRGFFRMDAKILKKGVKCVTNILFLKNQDHLKDPFKDLDLMDLDLTLYRLKKKEKESARK
ncbi:jg16814 [Pararge aegeria aegeria]|uniref:Jg16814 protein n=1 Tax=Pararge aegeria aegeria TaxID=348720 RepID=A0A8S4SKH0_9NEOP|nr:jg16814 [Pararge aegeria aegeria]